MLACPKREGLAHWQIKVIRLQHDSNRPRKIHFVQIVKDFYHASGLLTEAAQRKQCNSSHVQSEKVCTSCPGRTLWQPFPQSTWKNKSRTQFNIRRKLVSIPCWCSCHSPVSDVARVVDPHKFIETVAPPSGQLQPNMEAVLSFRMWVPPAEPIAWKLGLFLTKNDKERK